MFPLFLFNQYISILLFVFSLSHFHPQHKKGKAKLGQLDLEGALIARDRVGIQDFVLLDAHNSETAFLDNLKKRFSEDLIYTYIGTLLISINPYKMLDIYTKKQMDFYMGVNFFELPPHIYAVADNAYHTMLMEANNHFILISGESGAGKTEASKKILQYYAVSCPSTTLLDTVRDCMLMSNPVLEAFGNAKTMKNDNSSRFGKYMDIQFDSQVLSPFTIDHAVYARDALAKAIYSRTFTWLVNKINESLENKDSSRKTVIGLLDIYGFEVFSVNSFEQFCINFCNEKLQQLFIQLTMKAEQEEYEAEGIGWEPVQFFNNKIICDLVEEQHRGIISVLDEECLRPGDATDLTFLEKLEQRMGNHPHFVTHKLADKKTRKTLERGDFRLLHYAGEVTYCIVGFIDKNNDLLYKNIKEVMCLSKIPIIHECFPATEADSRRRPETVATQFKNSLLRLTEILTAKEAWYVRCLKSNENKQPGKFDEVLVRHQVKYLGLMEHLMVRRAGFAYRRRYDVFLQRYKALCPVTWPHWRGVPSDGVETLVQHLGYQPDEYKMGRTKIFIRYARTLFATEDAFEICKHELATRIQAKYKGYRAKGEFRKQKEAATKIETCWRGVQARKERERRAWAVKVIKKFIKGYMTRHEAITTDNTEYLAFVQQSYLNRLKDNLPKTVLDKTTWLTPPPVVKETSAILRQLHTRMLVRKYVRGTTSQKKAQLQQKVVTSAIFKGKKESYPQSIPVPFVDTRINEQDINMRVLQTIRHERIKYSIPVVKYDRNGFKPRQRQLILTQAAVYLAEEAKIKQRVDYVSLKGVSVSNLGDSIMILHVTCGDPKQKGDLVLQCDHLFEVLTKLAMLANKQNNIKVVQGSIKFEIHVGKESCVDFSTGQEHMVYKGKNGNLMVVSPRIKFR
ncbi:unconventional myosin-Ih-like [Xyrauchen texanus]|uniref:unconventional myosin-Ih-like n=1 Tax=Xyrauchen texanus TaxID=154827 RepID=UPI0022425143|nr:unconventional myosin-Ih-like [Xyrauchen texanus]